MRKYGSLGDESLLMSTIDEYTPSFPIRCDSSMLLTTEMNEQRR
jgi:hypothetical protein